MTTLAICVGINYTNLTNELQGCVEDCNEFMRYLDDKQSVDEFIVLTDQPNKIESTRAQQTITQPTIDCFNSALKMLLNEKYSKCYIYYAGHGVFEAEIDTSDEEDGLNECLCFLRYDKKTESMFNLSSFCCSFLSMPLSKPIVPVMDYYIDNRFKSTINQLRISRKSKLIIYSCFDCCHSGTITDMEVIKDYESVDGLLITDTNLLHCNVSACQDSQLAWETKEGGNFTKSLIEYFQETSKGFPEIFCKGGSVKTFHENIDTKLQHFPNKQSISISISSN